MGLHWLTTKKNNLRLTFLYSRNIIYIHTLCFKWVNMNIGDIMAVLCGCGCRKMVKFNIQKGRINRFIQHHFSRSKEHRKMMSSIHKGKKHTLGHKHSEEFRKNCSERMTGNQHLLGHVPTEETRKKLSIKENTQ